MVGEGAPSSGSWKRRQQARCSRSQAVSGCRSRVGAADAAGLVRLLVVPARVEDLEQVPHRASTTIGAAYTAAIIIIAK